jgi:hypothetical protein
MTLLLVKVVTVESTFMQPAQPYFKLWISSLSKVVYSFKQWTMTPPSIGA